MAARQLRLKLWSVVHNCSLERYGVLPHPSGYCAGKQNNAQANSIFFNPKTGTAFSEKIAVLLPQETPVRDEIWTHIPLDSKVEPVFYYLSCTGWWDCCLILISKNTYRSIYHSYYVIISYSVIPFYITTHSRVSLSRIDEAKDCPCCNLATIRMYVTAWAVKWHHLVTDSIFLAAHAGVKIRLLTLWIFAKRRIEFQRHGIRFYKDFPIHAITLKCLSRV